MTSTALLVAGVPGALVLFAAGGMYGHLVAGLHWGLLRVPIGLAMAVLGVCAGILLEGWILGPGGREIGDELGAANVAAAAHICGALYVFAGLGALVAGGRYSRWVAVRYRGRGPLWREWPPVVPRVVLPLLVTLTGVVVLTWARTPV